MYDLNRAIQVARGDREGDLLLKNCRLVNVLSGEVHEQNILVDQGIFAGTGDYRAKEVFDLQGRYVCPALIEGHIHIESTLLNPVEFARVVSKRGTGVVICDPHEIANVLGVSGLEYFLQVTENLAVEIYLTLPSCVPSTDLETAGARLDVQSLSKIWNKYGRRIVGLGEVMNFPGVVHEDDQVLAKIALAGEQVIDGHCPGLSGKELDAYILAGPGSDHESTALEEAREKLQKGMHLMIREGSSEKNLSQLAGVINDYNSANVSLVTDDRHPDDLLHLGHMDYNVRLAIDSGVAPIRAIQMASINTARYFRLWKRGAVAPGFRADFIILNDLEKFSIEQVFLRGQAVNDAHFSSTGSLSGINNFHIGHVDEESLSIKQQGKTVRAIEIVPDQILTKESQLNPVLENGMALADAQQDLAKLAVIERYSGKGNIGLGFVKGLGLLKGAMASSIAHDSHNLIVAGMNDQDMLLCIREAQECGGGLFVALDGQLLAKLELPLAGLMSEKNFAEVIADFEEIGKALQYLGVTGVNTFMQLSFLALPVIPELKLTDMGLVDTRKFEYTSLWVK